jgi:hypothetical protein
LFRPYNAATTVMKPRYSLAVLGLLTTAMATADYSPTSIRWYGWEVSTSEDLIGDSRITHYPIANMFDGDPNTAWVFKRNPPPKPDEGRESNAVHWGGKYAIGFDFRKEGTPKDPDWGMQAKVIDGIDIMNGYNKSLETFRRNNRVVQVAIYDRYADPKNLIKTADLSDKMGWHHISLPRRAYYGLIVTFTGIRKGVDNDVAISEVRLTKDGRAVPTGLGKAYLATTGSECG